jgi:hypothetical protein
MNRYSPYRETLFDGLQVEDCRERVPANSLLVDRAFNVVNSVLDSLIPRCGKLAIHKAQRFSIHSATTRFLFGASYTLQVTLTCTQLQRLELTTS